MQSSEQIVLESKPLKVSSKKKQKKREVAMFDPAKKRFLPKKVGKKSVKKSKRKKRKNVKDSHQIGSTKKFVRMY